MSRDPNMKQLDVRKVIKEAVGFLLMGSTIRQHYELDDHLWPVYADESRFTKVIQSLTLNSLQAMSEEGTLTIRATNISSQSATGEWVKIELTDSGSGIDERDQAHIFEPYYSTKEKAHGLGLSVSAVIVKQMGGSLRYNRDEDQTTFEILVPRYRTDVSLSE